MTVSLGRIPEKVLYTAACAEDWEEKNSDWTGINSMSSSGSSLPPLTRILELGHLRLLGPARVLRAASALLATQVN